MRKSVKFDARKGRKLSTDRQYLAEVNASPANMNDVLSLVGILAFGWLGYAFWYAGRDQVPTSRSAGVPGKSLVS
jgi:hypothetical protein